MIVILGLVILIAGVARVLAGARRTSRRDRGAPRGLTHP
jgi:hypothetical protein